MKKIPPNTSKFGNGLILLIRVGKSIWLKWVNNCLSTGGKDDKDSGGKDSSDGRASTDKGYGIYTSRLTKNLSVKL